MCGYFFKTTRKSLVKPLKININNNLFIPLKEEGDTVKQFLKALSFKQEDASVYISKNTIKDLDLDELHSLFSKNKVFKNLAKVEFNKTPKNCKTNSILLLNSRQILHVHLIKEPDSYSNWKIYQIERE